MTARQVALIRSSLDRRPVLPTGDATAEARLARTLRTLVPLRVPFVTGYIEARTRFFDDALLAALRAGLSQVVIVGAGYDGRALRYRRPDVTYFELDHPATQADKQSRLRVAEVDASDVRFVPVDFGREKVGDALAAAGHDPAAPTHFMCEGVTAYVPEPDLLAALESLHARAATGATLAVDFAESPSSTDVLHRVMMLALQARTLLAGERIVTAVTVEEARAMLQSAGWGDVRVDRSDPYPALFVEAHA